MSPGRFTGFDGLRDEARATNPGRSSLERELAAKIATELGAMLAQVALDLAAAALAAVDTKAPAGQGWSALEVDAPVDGLGRPTGKMTIRKKAS